MELVIVILESAIILAFLLAIRYVKKLPEQLHERQLKQFQLEMDKQLKQVELEMNKQLEEFKADLTREIELLKINESNLYLYKANQFEKLLDSVLVKMLDEDYVKKLDKDKRTMQEFRNNVRSLGTKLFFYASDETVKKFVDFRLTSLQAAEPGFDSTSLIVKFGELIFNIRKDLGYKDTKCTIDDYLNILLNDWEKHKHKYIKVNGDLTA